LGNLKKYFFLFLLIGLIVNGYSQNLVLNPGFEEYIHCPKGLNVSVSKSVKNWYGCGANYFNKCGYIFSQKQEPRTGQGYVSTDLSIANIKDKNLRSDDYLEGTLKCSLNKGQLYYFEMYLLLNKYFNQNIVAVDKIDLYFFNKLQKDLNSIYQISKPDIEFLNNNFYSDTLNWMKLSGYYTARGEENYFIIGNYYLHDQVNYISVRKEKKCNSKKKHKKSIYCNEVADYFIDDVKLVPVDSLGNEIPCKCIGDTMSISNLDTSKVYKIDEPIVLNNVYFETAKYDLLPESNTELDNLVILLKENISYKIEIDGHTDNTGNEKDNQVLSENRAKAVVDYILNKGISKDRLSYKGYGSSKPIADNNIDEGKAKNRRVEFKIVSK